MKFRVKLRSFLRLLAIGLVGALTSPATPQTVITADRMIDVLTGKMVEHPAIFVGDDGRITGIADARTIRIGGDVKHIDLGGKILLPGLIDKLSADGFGS